MKPDIRFLTYLILIILINITSKAQGLSIGSETTLYLGSSILYLPDDWHNEGTLVGDYGTIVFNGGTGDQILESSEEDAFSFLIVDKASGDLKLMNNITINGDLTILNGDLDGNNNIVTLTPQNMVMLSGAALVETPGNTFKGGIITSSPYIAFPENENIMGGIISTEKDMGLTSISRGHTAQTGNNTTGILRYYDIIPEFNSNLNATFVFSYDESEIEGFNEDELVLFGSTDDGQTWAELGGIVDQQENTVTINGLNSFPRLTLASGSDPLPVELANLTAVSVNNSVKISWQTISELNNKGFNVERKIYGTENNSEWTNVGFVNGYGTTTEIRSYSFVDKDITNGNHFLYRLKQIDNNGRFKYSDEIDVQIIPVDFRLAQNFPNPFNPRTIISFQLPVKNHVSLKVFDIIGNEIITLVNQVKEAGFYKVDFNAANLSSGIYFYALEAGSFNQVRKMTYVK